VSYGEPSGLPALFRILVTLMMVNVLPNGKSFKLYGTSFYFVGDKRPFLEDWATLFRLLEEGKIKPVIAKKFPILEAAQANALLESGQVIGNVVLVAPEWLEVGVAKDWPPAEASDECGEQPVAQAGSNMRSSLPRMPWHNESGEQTTVRQEIDWFSGDRHAHRSMEWSCLVCSVSAAK